MSIDFSGAASTSSKKGNDRTYYALLNKVEHKANRVAGNAEGNVAALSANGDLEDGGVSTNKLLLALDAYRRGNIPVFDNSNQLLDSGFGIYTLTKWDILHNEPYYTQTNLLTLAEKFKEYLSATNLDDMANSKMSMLQDAIDTAIKLREYFNNPDSLFVSQLPINVQLHDMLVLIVNMCNSLDQISQLKGASTAVALKVPDSTKERWTALIDFFENIENLKQLTNEQLLTIQKQKLILRLGLSPLQLDYNFLNTIIYASNKP